MSVYAALDLGTNSFHLVIAEFDAGGRFQVIAREKEAVRLGHGSGDMKELTTDAIDRGVDTLRRMRQIAEGHDTELAAVATSAVREATNRADFLHRARQEAGVEVEVIQGSEEARLIHMGAIQSVSVQDRRHLVIDIGGGSTEFVVGDGPAPVFMRSLKLGAIRLTDRFFPTEPPAAGAVATCRLHVRAFLSAVVREIEGLGFEMTIGCSGTIEAVVQVAAGLATGTIPNSMANVSATAAEIHRATEAIVEASPDERIELGVDKARVDLIVAGALLLDEIVDVLGVTALTVSDYALREGLLLDRRQQEQGGSIHHLSDLRRHSALGVAERYQEDIVHASRITDLALELFDATIDLHGLAAAERDLLETAGLLHNIGLFVSHSAHHKHSYYLIRHSESLAGFTENELAVVALVARYHRKSAPKDKHPEFAELRESQQWRVRVLAGVLRVAIALDRTRSGAIQRVTVQRPTAKELSVIVHSAPETDVSLELFTARQRCGLLGKALSVEVDVMEADL